jgi:hypothetical protein
MSIQFVPLETLQKIRQHFKSALVLPEGEDKPRLGTPMADEEPPVPGSLNDLGGLFNFGAAPELETHAPNVNGKWVSSASNPGVALLKLPGLRLRPDFRLVTYLARLAQEGVGVTWAVPEASSTTALLQKVLDQDLNGKAPQPAGALAHVMEAVEGDRSPLSFIIASLLQRELQEFGATGKRQDWTHHRLINTPPTQVHWEWQTTPPKDLSPKVMVYPDQRAAIEFFSCRVVAPVAVFQHIDQYPATGYRPMQKSRIVAIPKKG